MQSCKPRAISVDHFCLEHESLQGKNWDAMGFQEAQQHRIIYTLLHSIRSLYSFLEPYVCMSVYFYLVYLPREVQRASEGLRGP